MKIFLFRLSNVLSVIIIGTIILSITFDLYSKYEKYNKKIEQNLKFNTDFNVEFISNIAIFGHILSTISLILILLTFQWIVFGKLSLWINKEKYLENFINLKNLIYRLSRVFSVFCTIMFLIYCTDRLVDYFQYGRIILIKHLQPLYISFFIFFFNVIFYRQCSLWINKNEKTQKLRNLNNIKYTLSKVLLVICICLLFMFCLQTTQNYIRFDVFMYKKNMIFLILVPTIVLIYNYLCFGKFRLLIQKPNEIDK